ncbi:hypothetical protein SLITO_v1c09270 [Spiroplasma litorale]|uniref:Uncharacterized protein n=1 Tax=Spiroplasma litorale TaxID=216942 RepID=A0A0K1W2Y5_9MOLU|nr:hypothetical protein [Spiroplasma litorale]AKX34538.1 hypothetical protein SLITO_v1c09270 [Spiroplasma litorale]
MPSLLYHSRSRDGKTNIRIYDYQYKFSNINKTIYFKIIAINYITETFIKNLDNYIESFNEKYKTDFELKSDSDLKLVYKSKKFKAEEIVDGMELFVHISRFFKYIYKNIISEANNLDILFKSFNLSSGQLNGNISFGYEPEYHTLNLFLLDLYGNKKINNSEETIYFYSYEDSFMALSFEFKTDNE